MIKKLSLFPLLLIMVFLALSASALELDKYPELKKIAYELTKEKLYTQKEIDDIFTKVVLAPKVVSAFKRPAEHLSWARYRKIFITDKAIENGVRFWTEHEQILNKATREYGVPAEIISAIVGVETRYGTNKGSHSVINSLSTLSVQYERRKDFFQTELKSFLELSKQEGLDPLTTLGSYAGAMGIPQFIASSYQAYGIDSDGDGQRDLINSYPDAISSVANYLNLHGWKHGEDVIANLLEIDDVQAKPYLQSGKKPNYNVGQLTKAGIKIEGNYAASKKADLIKLQAAKGTQYQIVFENFYVIKRYNQSNLYAMAVTQLSQAIKKRKQK